MSSLTQDPEGVTCEVSLNLHHHTNENFNFRNSENFVTGREAWIYGYDPDTKIQLSQWVDPRLKEVQSLLQMKSLLIIFFDSSGIIHYEFTPPVK